MCGDLTCKSLLNDPELKKRVETVAKEFPNCVCESHATSDFSPGIVQDVESLVRIIMSPIDIDEASGELKPDVTRDAGSHGMSCLRMQGVNASECASLGRQREDMKREKGHKYQGFVALSVRDVRLLSEQSQRAYCVYDTAEQLEVRHAEVMCALTEKSKRKEYQVKLWGLMNSAFKIQKIGA
jgi:hypothetical protein